MLVCVHRVNSRQALSRVPQSLGVEIDIRSWGDTLHLEHDPYVRGEDFEYWLEGYSHAFIILNVKEEGLEERIISLLDDRGISDWAFLDQSVPFLIKLLRSGETRTMIRESEHERMPISASTAVKAEWIWLDSFTGRLPSDNRLTELVEEGYKFMIVSPELQGRDPQYEVKDLLQRFKELDLPVSGVCTKKPELWLQT